MTSHDHEIKLCGECPLPDCLPHDPGCLLKRTAPKRENRTEDIPFPFSLRDVARKLGLAYETVRFRIKKRQWHKLPELFRTGPGGDWKCTPEALDAFVRKMRGGAA